MPKQQVTLSAHTTSTNHRIIARSGESYPESAYHQTTPQLPDLVHVSAAPGREKAPLPPLIVLQAYGQILRNTPDPDYQRRYSALLDQLAKSEQNNVIVLSALAETAAKEGTVEGNVRAIQFLQRAVRLGSTTPDDYLVLGDLLFRSGRGSEAVEILQKAIAFDPYERLYYQSLALCYLYLGRTPEAIELTRQGLQLFPENSVLRSVLEKANKSLP
jgi:tetratricopeptide (TPR) repeat protein